MFYLVIQFILAGQIGLGLALPFPDLAACEKAVAEGRVKSNLPSGAVDTNGTCVPEDTFLKQIGERKA